MRPRRGELGLLCHLRACLPWSTAPYSCPQVLGRGERLEVLVEKTDTLGQQAFAFKRQVRWGQCGEAVGCCCCSCCAMLWLLPAALLGNLPGLQPPTSALPACLPPQTTACRRACFGGTCGGRTPA